MSFMSKLALVFALLGALDRILGNHFGLGKEFEKGFMLLGSISLSMLGMIVLAPVLADLLQPVFGFGYHTLNLDPSIIPASLFANDMGGTSLSLEVYQDAAMGKFNALVVSSMMGATISFNIPYAMAVVKPERYRHMLFGFLCGIVTIPLGCFVSGLVYRLPMGALLLNLLPLMLLSALVAAGLLLLPDLSVKIFNIFGILIKIFITVGLALGILRFMTGIELIKGMSTLEEGARICLNTAVVLAGMFPFMFVVSKLLSKPLRAVGKKLAVSETSVMGLLSTIVSNATTFEMLNSMDTKGIVLNSAFAISAAFSLGSHLAFTLALDPSYLVPVLVGKLTAGFAGLILAIVLYKRVYKNKEETL